MSLKVAQLPSRDLAFTNHAYLNPSDPLFTRRGDADNIVLSFNGKQAMFRLDSTPLVTVGTVALNKYQRDAIIAGLGTEVAVRLHKFNPAADRIHSIELSIESLQSLQQRQRLTLKEEEIANYVKATFQGKPFNRDTDVAIDYANIPYKITVNAMKTMLFSDARLTEFDFRNSQFGILDPSSTIKLSVPQTEANRFLTLVKKEEEKAVFNSDWNFEELGIGGLDKEAGVIFRRAFASRLLPPEIIKQHKIKHVKGMLLYGPPGTGKTLIARQIGSILGGKPPTIINGPELLDKYVGEAEKKIRALFDDAIADYKENQEAAALHVLVFDEIDSICKKRGSVRGGTGVHDTVVNQLLTMIDGVDSPNNILVIGMTNRKDLLDPALLRPGRLEVHVEISLPDEAGRLQILKIHTTAMRENETMAKDVDLKIIAHKTSNYSGGELEGVVKAAQSYAIANAIDMQKGKMKYSKDVQLIVTQDHFERALGDTPPAFGVDVDTLASLRGTIIQYRRYEEQYKSMLSALRAHVQQVSALLIHGESGTGATAMAADLATDLGAPFIKVLANYQLIGYPEIEKINRINEAFDEAYKSPESILIIDDVERLIEYTDVGPRFSTSILQSLLSLLAKPHPRKDGKLTIILTTKKYQQMADLDIPESAGFETELLPLQPDDVDFVAKRMNIDLHNTQHFRPEFVQQHLSFITIKRLITTLQAGQKIASEMGCAVNEQILTEIIKASTKKARSRY